MTRTARFSSRHDRHVERLRQLKASLVATLARVLYLTGILHVLVYARLRRRAVVLMYHRVIRHEAAGSTFSHPGIIVDADTFEKQMRFLHRHCHVVPAEEFGRRMAAGNGFSPRTCLITFDDGWEDNYTAAFPVLRKYDLPAIVFLATAFTGSKARFWQETLIHSICSALTADHPVSGRRFDGLLTRIGIGAPRPTADTAGKLRIQDHVCQLKHVSEEMRVALLDEVREIPGVREDLEHHSDTFLDWDQVREMAAGGITFGSHTVSHELMTRMGPDRAAEELSDSKRIIERVVGAPVVAFSYPNGSYDTKACGLVAAHGYRMAFSTDPGLVRRDDDPYRIKRINIHQGSSSTIPLFMARVAGVL